MVSILLSEIKVYLFLIVSLNLYQNDLIFFNYDT